jgi:hypothetical protein
MMLLNWQQPVKPVKIFPIVSSPSAAFAVDRPIMAHVAVGHRHRWQAHPSERQLHLHHSGGRIFHEMGRGEAHHQYNLVDNKKKFWQNIICHYGVP